MPCALGRASTVTASVLEALRNKEFCTNKVAGTAGLGAYVPTWTTELRPLDVIDLRDLGSRWMPELKNHRGPGSAIGSGGACGGVALS